MGGASGGGSGGGSTSTQTVQKADPWSGQQPFLSDGFDQAKGRLVRINLTSFPVILLLLLIPMNLVFSKGL